MSSPYPRSASERLQDIRKGVAGVGPFMFNFVMKKGAKNEAKNMVEVFDQIKEIYPTKTETERLKILTSRFKSSPSNYSAFANFLEDKSFWESNPSLRDVILELACIHFFNNGVGGSVFRRWYNAVKEGVDEVMHDRNSH